MTTQEILTLTHELSTSLRRIDENKLNSILEVIPNDKLQKIVREPLPKPSKIRKFVERKTPTKLKILIRDTAILDEPDYEKRMKLFIGFCRFNKYSYNTTQKYINILKSRNVFGENANEITIKPSRLAFANVGNLHERAITVESFVKLSKHLHENFSKYNAPLLIAIYTGLRTFEILQWMMQVLYQLKMRQEYVSVLRKQTVITVNSEPTYWKPVYTTRFARFIDQLVNLYNEEYAIYLKHGINAKMFNFTPKTLVNRLRQAFFESNGYMAPRGFGIHSCRNMIATIMSNETDNISSIQAFLQHKDVTTTKKYINVDLAFMRKEFDRLTRSELAATNKELLNNKNLSES